MFHHLISSTGAEGRERLLEESTTVYVGNLSFYTSESQLYELFSRCGDIKRVIMGLDKFKKTPCGFCFVEYEERESALNCLNTLNHTHLDGRTIKIDIDTGFREGRQFGRGEGGGQLGDEKRNRNNDGGPSSGNRGRRPNYLYAMQIIMCLTIVIYCCSIFSLSSPVQQTQYSRPMTNTYRLRRIPQTSAQGLAFEQYLARLLVDFMKVSKPTLMQAFMRATLEDPKLKETAINIFFNSSANKDP